MKSIWMGDVQENELCAMCRNEITTADLQWGDILLHSPATKNYDSSWDRVTKWKKMIKENDNTKMGPNAVYARNSLVTVLVHWNFAAVFTLILTITTQSFYLFWPWPRSVILLSNSVFQVPPKSLHLLCVQPICYIRLLRSICTGFLNDSANILKLHHNNHHRSAPPAFSLTDSVIETYPAASPAEKRCKHWSR